MDYTQYYALIPYYDDYGQNCTQVLLADGSSLYFKGSVRTFVKKLYYSLFIDPLATQHWACHYLHTTRSIPLLIDADTIFLPCKMRRQVPHGDGCLGYVLARAVQKIEDDTVTLTNGITLSTCTSKRLLSHKLTDARNLRSAYLLHPPTIGFHPLPTSSTP